MAHKHESLFGYMRYLNGRIDSLYAEAKRLSPRAGCIGVGGAHIDPLAKASGLEELLRQLRREVDIPTAVLAAKAAAAECLEKWNNSRKDKQVHRWASGADATIEQVERDLLSPDVYMRYL